MIKHYIILCCHYSIILFYIFYILCINLSIISLSIGIHFVFIIFHDVVLDPEQKALQDGRIGSEVVIVDPTSQCGNMRVEKERIEVMMIS